MFLMHVFLYACVYCMRSVTCPIYPHIAFHSDRLSKGMMVKLNDAENLPSFLDNRFSDYKHYDFSYTVQSACQNNGGCVHLCVLNPGGRKCLCKAGWKVVQDGVSCKSLDVIS